MSKKVRCCNCGKELVVNKNNPGIHTCYDLQELQRQEIVKLRAGWNAAITACESKIAGSAGIGNRNPTVLISRQKIWRDIHALHEGEADGCD